MTICIAAIANLPNAPTVLFCADRLISAGIQFNSGSSKIIQITQNCAIMESSDDSLISESILERIRNKLTPNKEYSIKEIADMVRNECIEVKKEKVDQDVLSKYNFLATKLSLDPNSIVKDAMSELRAYQYPYFEFIVCGIDNQGDRAHLYKVDQDGNLTNWDFLGFVTIGSGSQLAFTELTKWFYSSQHPLSHAIPRIYFAKKVSERAQGVGTITDYGFLALHKPNNKTEFEVGVFYISTEPNLMKDLEQGYKNILQHEMNEITTIQNQIEAAITNKAKEETQSKNNDEKT
jgi:20S proteasome alpha/beta subunit